jgi:hypothetical protein
MERRSTTPINMRSADGANGLKSGEEGSTMLKTISSQRALKGNELAQSSFFFPGGPLSTNQKI